MGDRLKGNDDLFPKSQSDTYVNAIICFVDTNRNVFDAISTDGLRFIPKCQYLDINPDFSGEIRHPSAGTTCVIKLFSDGSSKLVELYTPTAVDTDGVPNINLGPYSKFMPGDRVWLSKGGAFLQLLRNGLSKIGVTPLCQMIFMKLENYTRWISRNIEILASGFRFYSVNSAGNNVTRLSIFLTDAMSAKLRNASSETSDFEIIAKDNALTIMYGPKDEEGNRQNLTMIDMVNTGALIIYQNNVDTGTMQRKIMFNPNGSSADTIYSIDGKNTVIYEKTISTIDDVVSVLEHTNGDITLLADGHVNFTAGKDVLINGVNVYSVAQVAHSTDCAAHLVQTGLEG